LNIVLKTERTLLLPATPSDLPTFAALWNDADVRTLLFDGDAVGPAQALRMLHDGLAQAQAGLGWWLIFPWSNAPALGCVGLLRREVTAPAGGLRGEAVDTVLAFGPEAWALGYAEEATKALVWHATQRLGLPRLRVRCDAQNSMFDGLLRGVGFQAYFEADPGRRRLRLYELRAAPATITRQTTPSKGVPVGSVQVAQGQLVL
jgi:RimJ/RimL family protein N-acetyltransferase